VIRSWLDKITTPLEAEHQGYKAKFYFDPSHKGLTGTVRNPKGQESDPIQLPDWDADDIGKRLLLTWLKQAIANQEP
jgi:hypothetical protein